MEINIKQIKNDYRFTLHKMSMNILGEVPIEFAESLTRSIDMIDELKFVTPKYMNNRNGMSTMIHPLYDEIKEERYICLDDKECFVIKDVEENDGVSKSFVARSKEVKLGKIDINIEDIGLQLYSTDMESDIISLNDYMKEETGWSLGNVSENIAYDFDENGVKTEKVRWQESINSNWYDFLTKDIKDQFSCIVTFDSYHKKVNLLDIDSFGDNISIYLSHDNYIKSLKNTTSSQEIVTRLKVVGSEDMDIISATVTGYPYLENYSYFLENGEMSAELHSHIKKYEHMLTIREPQWKQLVDTKQIKMKELRTKNSEVSVVYGEINANERIKNTYETNKDEVNYAKIVAELTKLYDEKVILEVKVRDLEEEISNLQKAIDDLNILCKRETATNEHGQLIFNEKTLEELKEFVYYDTYDNGSFLEAIDLVNEGKRKLSLGCFPTSQWSIDVINFLKRLIDNGFRQHWNGVLGLGDIIMLHDKENNKDEFTYFVGYTQNFKDKSLQIELSNKKTKVDDARTISDTMGRAEKAARKINRNTYLLMKQKYNRINLPKEMVERGNI